MTHPPPLTEGRATHIAGAVFLINLLESLNKGARRMASGLEAIASARWLHSEGARLIGLDRVAALSAGAAMLYPVFAGLLERRLRGRPIST